MDQRNDSHTEKIVQFLPQLPPGFDSFFVIILKWTKGYETINQPFMKINCNVIAGVSKHKKFKSISRSIRYQGSVLKITHVIYPLVFTPLRYI